MTKKPFHSIDQNEAISNLNSSIEGLASEERLRRLETYGKNEIEEKGGRTPLKIIIDQIFNTMVILLIIAGAVAGFIGDIKEMYAIFAIVILFVILGFVQEYRAEKAMKSLKKLSVPRVKIRSDGNISEISATGLVPGDIVILETGNIVPADCRIISAHNLKVQESMLTGENEAVEKNSQKIDKENITPGDIKNSLFMGTILTYGRGEAIVTSTGMNTELGKIATLLQNVKEGLTPLQKELDKTGKNLAILGGICAAAVMIMGYFSGGKFNELILSGVSVAVAVIPEGLPAVITITLAIGAQKMLSRNALIRKLSAVETLGSVNVICTDKTGTLTENRMKVLHLKTLEDSFDFESTSEFDKLSSPLQALLTCGFLCNDSRISETEGKRAYIGDPTETALFDCADTLNFHLTSYLSENPRLDEIPFDSDRKMMTTMHNTQGLNLKSIVNGEKYITFTKGSADNLLSNCANILTSAGVVKLEENARQKILEMNNTLSSDAIRVLGTALRLYDEQEKPLETDMIFIGLFGMIDPPRAEVREAIKKCKSAGIRTIMITGDHPLTAKSIAMKIGISDNPKVVTGSELLTFSDADLSKAVEDTCVFARVSPKDKLSIVEKLQAKQSIVSMTGDGVNDSPALKKADIGIAMGITGTDVSKEASKMVLLDDNFATIVNAVEQGRVIYDNIKRYICFSIGGNLGKVIVMLFAPLFGVAIVLFPIQLLWLNLLTDGLLGIGLGVEKPEAGVMNNPPRKSNSSIFSGKGLVQVLLVGAAVGLLSIIVGYGYFIFCPSKWETVLFNSIAIIQIGQALGVRSNSESFFSYTFRGNKTLMILIGIIIVLQILVLYIPQIRPFFNAVPLNIIDWIVCLLSGFVMIIIVEVIKKKLYGKR